MGALIAFEVPSGYGDGSGSGSGDGDGSGYGYGYGSGSGYGYGYGYGDGSGSGSGSGDGSGYGSGYGYGYGYGYGDDSSTTAYYAAVASQYARPNAVMALWKSRADGSPANGGEHMAPAKVGDVHQEAGPLALCECGTLHATFNPHKWNGERLWVVALYGEIAVSEDKLGALKREIVAEIVT